jgi:hypothetical protein
MVMRLGEEGVGGVDAVGWGSLVGSWFASSWTFGWDPVLENASPIAGTTEEVGPPVLSVGLAGCRWGDGSGGGVGERGLF